MSLQGSDSLNHIFVELKGKNKDGRLRASYELLNLVGIAHRGMLMIPEEVLDMVLFLLTSHPCLLHHAHAVVQLAFTP